MKTALEKHGKRFTFSVVIALLICITGWSIMVGIFVQSEEFNKWELLVSIGTATIIALAGMKSVYTIGDSWRGHERVEDNTVIIQQGGANNIDRREPDIPPNPYMESS